ncbi:ATP-binding protein [Candidatus Pacearchaeota archaeon]|nr:ATP-binding protein [Candidatus Pacearchaeota archaeon]
MALGKIKFSPEGQEFLLREVSQQYAGKPYDALKEYITNALDALDAAKMGGLIKVILVPSEHRIIVRDAGKGITPERMRDLPVKVGESIKRGKIDERGEKGLGLMSFGSLGPQMHMISRVEGGSNRYVRWELEGLLFDESNAPVPDQQMDRLFGGRFRTKSGTAVVLDVDKNLFNQKFKSAQVKQELREMYWPILEEGKIDFVVEVLRGGPAPESTHLEPFNIRGEEILNKTIQFMAKVRENGERKETPCSIQAHLWLDANAETPGKIAVYSRGVRVYKDILDLNEPSILEDPLWRCKQIRGFIDVPDLHLTIGRDTINTMRDSTIYRRFTETLHELNSEIYPIIEGKLKKEEATRESRLVGEVYSVLGDAWKQLPPVYVIHRRERGPRDTPRTPRDTPPVNGDPKRDGGGEGDVIERKGAFPLTMPELQNFDMIEEKMRSKLVLRGERPGVAINVGHPNYQDIVESDPRSTRAAEYVLRCITHPLATWEIQEAVREGGMRFADLEAQIAATVSRAEDMTYAVLSSLK